MAGLKRKSAPPEDAPSSARKKKQKRKTRKHNKNHPQNEERRNSSSNSNSSSSISNNSNSNNSSNTSENHNFPPTLSISQADHDATYALLQTVDWSLAKNTSRRNVIRADDPATPRDHSSNSNNNNQPYCQSFVFGRNMKDPAGRLSWWSTRHPEVYAALRDLMARYSHGSGNDNGAASSFSYTHITLNRNLRCRRHTDGGNAGLSYIAAFGNDYTGGALRIEAAVSGGGLPPPSAAGVVHDLRRKFVLFNGKTQPHETLPFAGGDRFTVVYYTSDIVPAAVDRRRRSATAIEASSGGGVSAALAAKFNAIKAKLGRIRKT